MSEKNIFSKLLGDENKEKFIQEAKNRFDTNKDYYTKYREVYQTTKILRVALPAISIILASYYAFYLFNYFVAIGLLILTGIEISKGFLLKIFFRDRMKGEYNIGAGSVSFILILLSMFASIQGITKFSDGSSLIATKIESDNKRLSDSIRTEFSTLIEHNNTAIADIQNSGDFDKANWVYDYSLGKAVNKPILSEEGKELIAWHKGQIDQLLQEQKTELANTLGKQSSIELNLQSNNIYYLWVLFGITLSIELSIIVVYFFIEKYGYMAQKQPELLSNHNKHSLTTPQLHEVLRMALSNTVNGALHGTLHDPLYTALNEHEQKPKIGFDPPNDLESAIRAGARDYRTLMKEYKVNINTIKSIIKKVENE